MRVSGVIRRMGTPRLLLVELLSLDRFRQFRSALYPFIRGFASAAGMPARWICLGFDPATQFDAIRTLRLPDSDLKTLLAVVEEHRATHVILNEHLEVGQERALQSASGAPRVFHPSGASYQLTCGSLLDWLDLGPELGRSADWSPRDPLVDVVEPDYAHELANARATEASPLVQIVCGPPCVYERSVARSDCYAGLDLSRATRTTGCAFCRRPAETAPQRTRLGPAELAARQVQALSSLEPSSRFPGEFQVESVQVLREFERFFSRILDRGVAPSAFYFGCRIDELLRFAPQIESVLDRIHHARHTIHLANVGVENFSPKENQRLNKSIDSSQVRDFLSTLDGWERRWPGTVQFDRDGGFGFILFTPWTTLEDLEINLEHLEQLQLQNVLFCLVSRLVLTEGRPITLLAERDGLTCAEFDDPLMARFCVAGCLTEWGEREIPWRFAHREVALTYRVALRLYPESTRGTRDPDAARLHQLLDSMPVEQSQPLACFQSLLRLVRSHPELRQVPELLNSWQAELELRPMPVQPELPGWTDVVRRAVRALSQQLGRPGSVEMQPDRMRITFGNGQQGLTLIVQPNHTTARAYLRTRHVAVSHATDSPLDTEQKRRIVAHFVRLLRRLDGPPQRIGWH
jgi:hypothetical protein